ncbi:unnamed protein product [Fraxinus pennsylvanica]|uniref:TRF2/HOY1 PH-like domain-containing protein n=1 Tax=Fraxinus pennsylvanica TaxID=56036 RepID=A0AAD1ZKJ9_9LAMI|nr:unnamed protein product [Fraxinus pennsylvanica]
MEGCSYQDEKQEWRLDRFVDISIGKIEHLVRVSGKEQRFPLRSSQVYQSTSTQQLHPFTDGNAPPAPIIHSVGVLATVRPAMPQAGCREPSAPLAGCVGLDQPPLFYRETNPQPRKHTLWQQSSDFTGGQASIWRRHYVQFAPGILDKHFPMLLQCDERMFALSHQPFPRQESPFFDSNIFGCSESTFNMYGHGSRFLPGMQYPYQAYPTNTSVKDFHSTMSNYQFLPENQTGWGQGGSFPTEENIQVAAAPINSVTQFADPFFAHPSPNYVGDSGIPNPNARVLYNVENHLLQDSQVVCCDETSLNSKVESTYSLLDPLEVNSSNIFAPIDANPNTQVMQNGIENSMSDGFYPQCISWISQYSNENVTMQPGVNNLVYPFVLEGSTDGNFSSSNSNPDIKKWT